MLIQIGPTQEKLTINTRSRALTKFKSMDYEGHQPVGMKSPIP